MVSINYWDSKVNSVSTLLITSLPLHSNNTGSVVVVESEKNVPFIISRVFMVRALKNEKRGNHAHKLCQQFLMCTSGKVEIVCDDGQMTRTFILDRPNQGLLIPAGIWAHQSYLSEDSVLTVFCDRRYEADDYIADYNVFRSFLGLE